jgi:hypothetical protein
VNENKAAVYVTCPSGHKTGTRKPSGHPLRCQQCLRESGTTVMMSVPPRPAEPPKRLAVNWGTDTCWTCRATAPRPGEKLLPAGWMTVMLGVNPAADKHGRAKLFLGPFCSRQCLITGLPDRSRDDGVNSAHLMTMRPSGRDR